MNNNEHQQNEQANAPKAKKKITQRWWFWVIIAVVVISVISSVAGGSEDGDQVGAADQGTSVTSQADNTTQANNAAQPNNKANLGDYNVVISSCRLAEDYTGAPIAIVKYSFTNVSDDSAAFMFSVDANAFQNGIGLNECYIAKDSANYSSDNQTKEIKKGATLDVEVAYKLNDTTTPVEIEVSEFISFIDRKVTKTFIIN